ncbi:MAG: TonB-dependent receptor [Gemmatimonadaceae bacterium]|nr:TonB-dependent receptor [Gemmatimonadaceae bacterium]
MVPICRASAQVKPDSAERASPLGAVVVSATRTEQSLKSLPTHVVVVGSQDVAASAAQSVPDLLRMIPGFATREPQSALVMSPSQSVVSFRGLGGSTAGRTLILLDGLPAGDPFSGWLDWGRIPLPLLESAEVVRGGGSPIWGSRALGGVVNLRTLSPTRDGARLLLEGGSFGTKRGSGAATVRRGKLGASLAGDYVNTDGFLIIRKDQSGPADSPEPVRSYTVTGKVIYDASKTLQTWAGGSTFNSGILPVGEDEEQRFDDARLGLRWARATGGIATISVFANRRTGIGNSTSFNTARTVETLARQNRSPAASTGLTLQWTQMAFSTHELSIGADLTSTTGKLSEDHTFASGVATRQRNVGGGQQIGGVFVQDAADLGHGVRLVASARADAVRSDHGRRTELTLPTRAVLFDSSFADRRVNRLTYSLGLRWQPSEWLGLRTSAYEAFRTPSLFEMYQPLYSSRGSVTESNPQLEAETLRGTEFGADVTLGPSFVGRVTAYITRVDSPIMDVTLGVAGTKATPLIPCGVVAANQSCAQRRNVDGLHSSGVETELTWRPTAAWSLGTGYSYSPTTVSAPGQPADRKQALRSMKHMATATMAYRSPRWADVSMEARYLGSRFVDDLNTIELPEVYLVGLRVNRALGKGMSAHVKVENLFNQQFQTTRTRAGLVDIGAPRWITAGVRAAW